MDEQATALKDQAFNAYKKKNFKAQPLKPSQNALRCLMKAKIYFQPQKCAII